MVAMFLLRTVNILFQVYFWLLIARILVSWVPEFQGQKWVQFIAFYTDPYLNLFRRIIPPIGMIDISPIFAFLGLYALQYLVIHALLFVLR